jgi:nucleolar pre-ribosomal-associated protein 1
MATVEHRQPKRRKLDQGSEQSKPDIRGAFELHDLLRFKQSTGPEVKAGVDQFKNLLTSIQRNEDLAEKEIQLKVLRQYCDDQASSKNDLDFPDLLATWSFAAQSNSELLLSAVPAALAQFFRTISTELDFREFGLSLCQSLLRREQLLLFDRGLSAPKFKDFLISPCLRLLTETVSFDGGALAGNVFSRRDVVFRRLDTLLDTSPSSQEDTDRRRPTVRRNAQRLLLALLKYLDSESRAELISQGKILHSCIRKLSLDGGDIVRDLLESFRRHLIDADLLKQVKVRFLNPGNLSLLAALYDFELEEADQTDAAQQILSVREAAHTFLVHVCTSASAVLLPQWGWYPSGFGQQTSMSTDDNTIELGLESPYYFDEYKTAIPVNNSNLSSFLQNLRPERDTLQAELITKTFEAAPELVADYFVKRPRLPSTSKDEAAWRNQLAFIFSIINLPVPEGCGSQGGMPALPPPISVVVESILPRPVDRAAISQWLKSSDDIKVMSAARLMTKALEKLTDIQEMFKRAPASADLWIQASSKLGDLMTSRAPTYHDFVTALQQMPRNQFTSRAAILECLATYNQVLPSAARGSKFDVGPLIIEVISQILAENVDAPDREDGLSRIVKIATSSSTIKWWHKSSSDQLSPFVSLIKVYVTDPFLALDPAIKKPIFEGLQKAGIIRADSAAAEAVTYSLCDRDEQVYLFAENCMIRTSKQPVKYLDQLEVAQEATSDDRPVSLIACCVAEQWPYILKTSNASTAKDLAEWVAGLFALLALAGENEVILVRYLRKEMYDQSGEFRKTLAKAFKYEDEHPDDLPRIGKNTATQESHPSNGLATTPAKVEPMSTPPFDLTTVFPPSQPLPSSLKGLTKWSNPDFDSELAPPLAASRIARLIQCLCSATDEVRLQAQQTLQTLMHALSKSTHPEKDQLYLLLGEVCETAKQHALTAAAPSRPLTNGISNSQKREKDPSLPSFIAALATLFLSNLTNPADKMYAKTNRYLLLGPTWTPVTRVIPYWIDQILLQEPEYDEPDMWEMEVGRFLDVLIAGMRSEQDLELYRKSGIFERLGSLYFTVPLGGEGKVGMKKKILHVFCNTMEVEGGADTLITRVGVRAWLDMVRVHEEREIEMVRVVAALKGKLKERCSKEYIERWESDRPIFRDGKKAD